MLSMYINITSYCSATKSPVNEQQHESVPAIEKDIENLLRENQKDNPIDHQKNKDNKDNQGIKKPQGDQRFKPSKNQDQMPDLSEINTLNSSGRSEGRGKMAVKNVIRFAKDQADFGKLFNDILTFNLFHGALLIIGRDIINLNHKSKDEVKVEDQADDEAAKKANAHENGQKNITYGLTFLRLDIGPQWFRFFVPVHNFQNIGNKRFLVSNEFFSMLKDFEFQLIAKNINFARNRRYSDCMFLNNLPLLFDAFNEGADNIAPKHNYSFNVTIGNQKGGAFIGVIQNGNLVSNPYKARQEVTSEEAKQLGKNKNISKDEVINIAQSLHLQIGLKADFKYIRGVAYVTTTLGKKDEVPSNEVIFLNLWNDFMCFDLKHILGFKYICKNPKLASQDKEQQTQYRLLFNVFETFKVLTSNKIFNKQFFKEFNLLVGICNTSDSNISGDRIWYLAIQIGALYIRIEYNPRTKEFKVNVSLAFYYVNPIYSHLDSLPTIQATNKNLPEALNV